MAQNKMSWKNKILCPSITKYPQEMAKHDFRSFGASDKNNFYLFLLFLLISSKIVIWLVALSFLRDEGYLIFTTELVALGTKIVIPAGVTIITEF